MRHTVAALATASGMPSASVSLRREIDLSKFRQNIELTSYENILLASVVR